MLLFELPGTEALVIGSDLQRKLTLDFVNETVSSATITPAEATRS